MNKEIIELFKLHNKMFEDNAKMRECLLEMIKSLHERIGKLEKKLRTTPYKITK